MFLSILFSQIELLPIAYALVVLCVVSAGVIARLLGQQLIENVPEWLAEYLSKPVAFSSSGDEFVEDFFDADILLNLQRSLLLGLILPGKIDTQGRQLRSQREGTINTREQVLAGKYWSGTQPKRCA